MSRLDEIFATQGDFVKTLKFMQQMTESLVKQLLGLPDWQQANVDLTHIADHTAAVEYYRYTHQYCSHSSLHNGFNEPCWLIQ